MKQDELFSIGQVEKMCDVSQRMLRYYEEQGLLKPDYVDPGSHYRYYSIETMRRIQIIRYLIDLGFGLTEIQEYAFSGDIHVFKEAILRQIQKTQDEMDYYSLRMESLREWCGILMEGEQILEHKDDSISVMFFPKKKYFFFSGEGESETLAETMYFTQSKQDGHKMVDVGGAFYYYYDSFADRQLGRSKTITLLQPFYPKGGSEANVNGFGGFLAVRSYHIGKKEGISGTYEKILSWCRAHSYIPRGDAIEKRLVDIYSTDKEDKFVFEIIIPVTADPEDASLLREWGR